MVKLKVLCRDDNKYQRETKFDIFKVNRSMNSQLHPFQKAREYQRALTAAKIEKIFAKPFITALQGSKDFINVFAKAPDNLINFLSGSYDGEIRMWDISTRKSIFNINAHENCIKGLTFSNNGQYFLSSGDDKSINLFNINLILNKTLNQQKIEPSNKFQSKVMLNNVDHQYKNSVFATSGQYVQIWNYQRSQPIQIFEWGIDSIIKVKFNPSEIDLLCATGIDRSIILYDLRSETPVKKICLKNKSNCICWNPMEPINFSIGNDDSNCYTFDMRKLETIKMIHKDHIKTVMDLDYAPSGREFVTGSYDKTIRLFPINQGKSREVYHGKRMQKVFAVCYSQDNQYVYSGSQDMNIRIWKAIAWKPIGNVQFKLNCDQLFLKRQCLENQLAQIIKKNQKRDSNITRKLNKLVRIDIYLNIYIMKKRKDKYRKFQKKINQKTLNLTIPIYINLHCQKGKKKFLKFLNETYKNIYYIALLQILCQIPQINIFSLQL